MRIKSYFASSVQAAIGLARREFGDEVTLVTSHASPLDSRHLGDYEVVFAIDDVSASEPEVLSAPELAADPQVKREEMPVFGPSAPVTEAVEKPAFEAVYKQEIAKPVSTEESIKEKLDQVRTSFMEMGIEPAMVRALLLIVERSLPMTPPVSAVPFEEEVPAEEPVAVVEEPAHPEASKFTPAEMEFFLSVSGVSS